MDFILGRFCQFFVFKIVGCQRSHQSIPKQELILMRTEHYFRERGLRANRAETSRLLQRSAGKILRSRAMNSPRTGRRKRQERPRIESMRQPSESEVNGLPVTRQQSLVVIASGANALYMGCPLPSRSFDFPPRGRKSDHASRYDSYRQRTSSSRSTGQSISPPFFFNTTLAGITYHTSSGIT